MCGRCVQEAKQQPTFMSRKKPKVNRVLTDQEWWLSNTLFSDFSSYAMYTSFASNSSHQILFFLSMDDQSTLWRLVPTFRQLAFNGAGVTVIINRSGSMRYKSPP